MNPITLAQLTAEIGDLHVVRAGCLFWRMRCLAHRLLDFGWENSVNTLDALEMLAVSTMLPPHMADVLVRGAYEIGDARWRAFIERTCPRLAEAS